MPADDRSGTRPLPVLLLAGTAEAAALAHRLDAEPALLVTSSLAGRTRSPAALPAPSRTGGFGGVDGLAAELRRGRYRLVVDATHPFAAQMPRHAAAAAERVGIDRVRLLRPSWIADDGDRWVPAADLPDAARQVVALGARRVLVTTGRQDLAPFATLGPDHGVHVVTRSIEAPPVDAIPGATIVIDRGPYTVEGELALLRAHRIDAVVTKDSGGAATAPKLVAARRLDLPVVVVARPPQPAGPTVGSVEDAVAWVQAWAGPATR